MEERIKKALDLWLKAYGKRWFAEAYALSTKLDLKVKEVLPIPEDGIYEVALNAMKEFVPQGSRVLDAGAGMLAFSHILANEGYEVIAVEINENVLSFGLSLLGRNGINVIVGDFRKIKPKFDAVVLLNTTWESPLPASWFDKVVITSAFGVGYQKGVIVVYKGEILGKVNFDGEVKIRYADY